MFTDTAHHQKQIKKDCSNHIYFTDISFHIKSKTDKIRYYSTIFGALLDVGLSFIFQYIFVQTSTIFLPGTL